VNANIVRSQNNARAMVKCILFIKSAKSVLYVPQNIPVQKRVCIPGNTTKITKHLMRNDYAVI